MNWLAHVRLSEPSIEHRLGNLLADCVKRKDRTGLSEDFLRGAECHQSIDVFTDYHPVVGRSRSRIREEWGRFSGILIDVFYDHFLAIDWEHYSDEPLEQFTAELYAQMEQCTLPLPPHADWLVQRIIHDDRLTSYRHYSGIAIALYSISERLRQRVGRTFRLERAIADLHKHKEDLRADFHAFFPELITHVRQWMRDQRAAC